MKHRGSGKPKKIIVRTTCPCGRGMRVKIMDKGEPLPEWELSCRKHQGQFLKVVIGRIRVSGRPPEPGEAAALVQRVMDTKGRVVRTVGHVEFLHNERFE